MAEYITKPVKQTSFEAEPFTRDNFDKLVEFTDGAISDLRIDEEHPEIRASCLMTVGVMSAYVYEGTYITKFIDEKGGYNFGVMEKEDLEMFGEKV